MNESGQEGNDWGDVVHAYEPMVFQVVGEPIYGKPVEIPEWGGVWYGIYGNKELREAAEYIRDNDSTDRMSYENSPDYDFEKYAKRLADFVLATLPKEPSP